MNPYQPPVADAPLPAKMSIEPFTSVGGLLGRAFSLYFGSFVTIAAVTLIVFGPVEFIKNYLIYAAGKQDDFAMGMRVEMLLEGVFGALITPALLRALIHRMQTGRECAIKEALSAGAKRWGSVFAARLRSGLLVVVGLVLLVVPGLYWMVRYSLTDEVATLERPHSARWVMSRSSDLTQGYGWKIFGVGLIGSLAVLSAQFVAGAAIGLFDHWLVAAAADCAIDVVHRFYVPLLLLVYLGVGGRDPEDTEPTPVADGMAA